MKYFFDNDISTRLAKMLSALGVEAVHLRDVYPPDTKDVVFLADLAKGEFDVFISNNSSQRRIPQEAALVKSAGIICLYFNPFWGRMKLWEQAHWLVKNWPKIDGFCLGAAKGTTADLQANGKASPFKL